MRRFSWKKKGMRYGKRHVPGVMNKTEERYSEVLNERVKSGEVLGWWFEKMTFKLADDTRFTPDFAVLLADGEMEMVDCKGWKSEDDALVKIKVAAETFPCFKWVHETSPKSGVPFKRREFN